MVFLERERENGVLVLKYLVRARVAVIVDINYRDDDDEERRVYLSNGIRNVSRLVSMAGSQSQALSSVLFLFFGSTFKEKL